VQRTIGQIEEWTGGELDGGGIAAGVADAAGSGDPGREVLGEAIGPSVIETVITGQIDHDRIARCVEVLGGRSVGYGEDHGIGTQSADPIGLGVHEAHRIRASGRDRLASLGPRRGESQAETRMLGDQADQFGPDIAAGADDADGD
jgi:hypothetical protein